MGQIHHGCTGFGEGQEALVEPLSGCASQCEALVPYVGRGGPGDREGVERGMSVRGNPDGRGAGDDDDEGVYWLNVLFRESQRWGARFTTFTLSPIVFGDTVRLLV